MRFDVATCMAFTFLLIGCDQRATTTNSAQLVRMENLAKEVGMSVPASKVRSTYFSDERYPVYEFLFLPDDQVLSTIRVGDTITLGAEDLAGVQSQLSTRFDVKTQVKEAQFAHIDSDPDKVVRELTLIKTEDGVKYGIVRIVDMR